MAINPKEVVDLNEKKNYGLIWSIIESDFQKHSPDCLLIVSQVRMSWFYQVCSQTKYEYWRFLEFIRDANKRPVVGN